MEPSWTKSLDAETMGTGGGADARHIPLFPWGWVARRLRRFPNWLTFITRLTPPSESSLIM